jgi:hypothetical protein
MGGWAGARAYPQQEEAERGVILHGDHAGNDLNDGADVQVPPCDDGGPDQRDNGENDEGQSVSPCVGYGSLASRNIFLSPECPAT